MKTIPKGTRVRVTLNTGEVAEGVTEMRTTAIMEKIVVRIPGRFMPVGVRREHVEVLRTYATDREETEPCQAGTPGCSIDHAVDHGGCEGW